MKLTLPMPKIHLSWLEALNFGLVITMVGLYFYTRPNLPTLVPFFYTLPWGLSQLAQNELLLLLPTLGLVFMAFNLALRNWAPEVKLLTLVVNLVLLWSIYRITAAVSPVWPHAYLDFKNIIGPAVLAATLSWLFSKPIIRFTKWLKVIDDPATHHHPGMLLTKPVPRGGALVFLLSFVLAILIIVPLNQIPVGIVAGAIIYTILGILDDKFDLNPYVRFGILAGGATIVAVSGVGITFFATPFGIARLDTLAMNIPFLNDHTFILTDIFTIFWILWVSNLLSWSNGIDGQFSGVAGITALFIALLSLRLIPGDHSQIQTTRIAAIAAGAALGMTPATWHPCKILWGFGATAVGLVLASLSVISGSKVATATLVVLIPFLDAIATIIRRLSLKKSPFWGDRGHLHHRLLDAGLKQPQIAIVYWIATFILGVAAVFTSGRIQTLAVMTLVLAVAALLILTNLKGRLKIPRLLKRMLPNPTVSSSSNETTFGNVK